MWCGLLAEAYALEERDSDVIPGVALHWRRRLASGRFTAITRRDNAFNLQTPLHDNFVSKSVVGFSFSESIVHHRYFVCLTVDRA